MNTATQVVPCARKEINLSPDGVARFWAKVDKSGGPDACWIWTASKVPSGYGSFGVNGRLFGAHRIAWVLENGQIPHDGSYHGMCVCHKCDNPACCNPAHLFLGTNMDNARDREKKGRGNQPKGDANGVRLHPECRPRGDKHWTRTNPEKLPCGNNHHSRRHPEWLARGESAGNVKLTTDQVIELRSLYASGGITKAAIAKKLGMGKSTIGKIIRRVIWTHV